MSAPLARAVHERRVDFARKIAEQARRLEEKQRREAHRLNPFRVAQRLDPLDRQLLNAPPELFKRPAWRLLAKEICEQHGADFDEVCGDRRYQRLVLIRQEIFYRIRVDLGMSYPEIGKRFNRDHTTILHGVRRHAKRFNLEVPTDALP
jgi:hypothetical protein